MNNNKDKELVGVKEIARRANVSIATVDRVIHNRVGVSEVTKNKINGIIKELDYVPNLMARRLASRKTLELASLIPQVSNETTYWDLPLNGILHAEKEIKQYGVSITKYFFDMNDKDSFIRQTEEILKNKYDGILLAPSFIEESIKFIQTLQKKKVPYVFINSDIPNQSNLCYIGPHLYQSGYLSAHMVNYLLGKDDKVLIVNISKEIENNHHLLRKEKGFRTYFEDHGSRPIVKMDINQMGYESIEKSLNKSFTNDPDIKLIFVTNSRVSKVAQYLEKHTKKDVLLIGYDFLESNIEFLKRGTIDFLICQKPQEQAYRGVRILYQNLVYAVDVEKEYYMPIDIITKENYTFYRN